MEASVNTFSYEPLLLPSYIRLLTLLPDTFDSPIRCVLQNTQLCPGLQYEAVSYVWGDATTTKPIALAQARDGVDVSSLDFEPFRVTANLEVLLRHLRRTHALRTLWIDAISINQSNLAERSQQVQRMRDIYWEAPTVIVWLGRHIEPSDASGAPTTCAGIDERENQVRAAFAYCRAAADKTAALMNPSEDVVKGIRLITRRPWWTRLWVIQEVCLANYAYNVQFVCGYETASWQGVVLAISGTIYTTESGPPSQQRYDAVEGSTQMLIVCGKFCEASFTAKPFSERILLALSSVAGRFRQTEPRDILYGILGLISPLPAAAFPALAPDYKTPLNAFYHNLARFLIMDTSTAYILGPAARDSARDSARPPGLPTWVPMWSKKGAVGPPSGLHRLRDASVQLSTDGTQLHVRGIELGAISIVATIAYSQHPESLRNTLQAFEKSALSLPVVRQRYGTLEESRRMLRRFCAAWLFPIGDAATNARLYDRLVGRVPSQHGQPVDGVRDMSRADETAALARQLLPAAQRSLKRSLIVTDTGHFAGISGRAALTESLVEVRARIFFIPASECLIFQPEPSLPHGYRLLGSCTVYGYEVKHSTADDHFALVEKEGPLVGITIV